MIGIEFLTGGFLYFASKISGLSVDVYGLLQWNKVNKPNQINWLLKVLTDQISHNSLVFEQFWHINDLFCPKFELLSNTE
jgi:hypothetical protein